MQLQDNIQLKFGDLENINSQTDVPFSDGIISFLDDLSKDIFKNCPKQYTDVISFAFFCRKANLCKQKEELRDRYDRLGRGLVFHIAPSNVPVNFAFSYVFSLLSGNIANIVRVPSKEFKQIDIILNSFSNLQREGKHSSILAGACFVSYGRDKDINDYFSSKCNARIIWGGDETIKEIKKSPIPSRAIDVAFADRYSICVIDSKSIEDADKSELTRLIQNFYNDTYFIDQNACSSPHLIVWKKGAFDLLSAKEKFFCALGEFTDGKYMLAPVNAVDKLTKAYELAAEHECKIDFSDKLVYRVQFQKLPYSIENLREKCGFFFEYDCGSLEELNPIINSKYQTVTYYGNIAPQIKKWVIESRLTGIDRIVPIGEALNIGLIWDGYNLAATLSRIVI